MIALALKYLTVIGGSMVKFIFGPLTGFATGLSFVETWLLTSLGMMCTVVGITFAGKTLKQQVITRFFKKRRLFTPNNRRMVKVWHRYGMLGTAFLTPLLLTPPGGSILAVSFGEKKEKIITYMLVSALGWGLFFTFIVRLLGDQAFKFFGL
jgi:hypothetical protein